MNTPELDKIINLDNWYLEYWHMHYCNHYIWTGSELYPDIEKAVIELKFLKEENFQSYK
jgi:hypothetical protein